VGSAGIDRLTELDQHCRMFDTPATGLAAGLLNAPVWRMWCD
jgi:hypothetical protein